MRCSSKWIIPMDSISILSTKSTPNTTEWLLKNRLHSVTIASLTSITRANIFPSYAASSKDFYSFPLRPLIPISIHLRNPKHTYAKVDSIRDSSFLQKDKNGLLKKVVHILFRCKYDKMGENWFLGRSDDFNWNVPLVWSHWQNYFGYFVLHFCFNKSSAKPVWESGTVKDQLRQDFHTDNLM